MLGGHSQTAASHTVHGQAKGIVQFQRAVAVAGCIAPRHENALRLHSGAQLTFQLITDLLQQYGGQCIGGGCQRDVGYLHPAQQLVDLRPKGRSQQQHLPTAEQVAGKICAAVLKRQCCARQAAVNGARSSRCQHLLLCLVQQGCGSGVRRPTGGPHIAQRCGAVNGGGLAALHYSRSRMPS